MIKHSSPISGIATYKDKYIATVGYDNKVILWNAKNHKAIGKGMHDHLANQCQFSPDGNYLVSSSSDYTARLWCVPEMKLKAVFNHHKDDVEGIAFHPSKDIVATSSRDHQVHIYDYDGNILQTLIGHSQDVLSVVWLNDQELLTSSDDGTVKKWDAFKGVVLDNIDLGGVETDTIALSENGVVFCGNDLGEIILLYQGNCWRHKAHLAGIKRLCYSSTLNKLISLSYDRSFSIWEVKGTDLTLLKTTVFPAVVWARSSDFLGDNQVILASFGSQYAIYNYDQDKWYIEHIESTYGKNAVYVMDKDKYSIGDAGIVFRNNDSGRVLPSLCNFFVKAGEFILTGGQTGQLFDSQSGDVIYQHHSPLNCATTFYQESTLHVAIGTYTGEVLIFKSHVNQITYVGSWQFHNNAIKGIAASGDYLYSVCATGSAAFHDIKNFSCKKYIEKAHDKISNDCAWLYENKFVSVSRDLTLRITDLEEQEIIYTPHKYSIKSLAVSKDREWIATGSYRGILCVYKLENKHWYEHKLTDSGISSLAFDEVNQGFIASSYDGNLYFLPLSEI